MRLLENVRRAVGMTARSSDLAPRAYKPVSRPFDATSSHPAIPNAPKMAADGGVRYLREQQALAEQMVRNDSWIRSLVRALCDIHVDTGPEPVSRFPELDDLFRIVSRNLHNSGKRSFGGMLREDFYRGKVVRGEHFGRLRLRFDRPEIASRLVVPMQIQPLPSAYVPVDHDAVYRGETRFQHGILTVLDRPEAYAFYTSHPYASDFDGRPPITVPAGEVYHLHDGPDGALRGEVMLASAFLRAISMSTVEDAERRRKQIAAIMSVFFTRTAESAAQAAGDDSGAFPDADRIGDMLRVKLGTGTAHELPPGFDAKLIQPTDEPENFEKALRFQLLGICATAGAPLHEVTGDWRDAPERALRLAGASIKRRANIERDGMEHQLLNPMWRHFVDAVQVAGLWSPPPGIKPWQLYEVDWDWPVIQAAALTQELGVMMTAVEKGHVAPSDLSKGYWGKRREVTDRVSAKDRARSRELGSLIHDKEWDPERSDTSRSIAEEVRREEQRERRLVEEGYMDDSVLDEDD